MSTITVDPTPRLLLTCSESADLVRVSTRTLRRWILEGRLPALRTTPGLGGRLLLRRADVLAIIGFVEEPPQPAPKAKGRR